ncbi:MAG: alkaline phosphatase family protein [Candidatus Aenigmatarchaeota archaeon]
MKKHFIHIPIITVIAIILISAIIYTNQYKDENVILVVIDGATWNIITPMLEKGELPNFARLMSEGSYGNLTTTPVPISIAAWTSIATGTWPDKHGLTDFGYLKIEPLAKTSKWVPYTSLDLKDDPIWRVLSNDGRTVGVVDWIFSYPPEKVNGFMVSVLTQFFDYRNNTYPQNLEREIESNIIKPSDMIGVKKNKDEDFIRLTILDEEYRMGKLFYLVDKYNPEFSAVGFEKIADSFQHLYWSYKEPRYFDVTTDEAEKYGTVIEDSYRMMDKFIGKLLNKNVTIILVSDHGFSWDADTSGPIILRDYLPFGGKKHIVFYFNRLLEKSSLIKLDVDGYASSIDFSESKAYFCNNFTAIGVCINLIGREKQGIVEKKDYDTLRNYIIERLSDVKLDNGEKVFVYINKTENSDVDIIFEMNPILKNKHNYLFKETNLPPYINDDFVIITHLINNNTKLNKIIINNSVYQLSDFIGVYEPGNHQMNGIIMMMGKNIKSDYLIKNAKVVDVAPTILYLMGEAIPKNMDGRILVEAIDKNFTAKTPIRYSEEKIDSSSQSSTIDQQQVDDMKEMLRRLGYLP